MAGSYNHIISKKGKFQGTKLLDNMGDAQEALEECFGMIQLLADQAGKYSGNDAAYWVEEARRNYKEGLEIAKKNKIPKQRTPR